MSRVIFSEHSFGAIKPYKQSMQPCFLTTQVRIDAKKTCFIAFPAFSGSAKVRKVATTIVLAPKKTSLGAKKAFLTPRTIREITHKPFLTAKSVRFTTKKVSYVVEKTVEATNTVSEIAAKHAKSNKMLAKPSWQV